MRSSADELRTERERLRSEHAAGASGLLIARAYADAVDELIRARWDGSARTAVVAVGGYGRREMNPASDVDVMVLHDAGRAGKDAGTALFYALWDAGLQTGHSIRTLKDARKIARTDFEALTAFLDARLVAGDRYLFARLVEQTLEVARADRAGFTKKLRAGTHERARTAGDASADLQPNVKEGRGALRDLHTIRWLDAVEGGARAERLADAADLLHRVRNELHWSTGRMTDVLTMEMHDQVGRALGFEDGQTLMRALYHGCRLVALALDDVLEDPVTIPAIGPPSGWTADARAAFLDVLRRGEGARRVLRTWDASGALIDALPEWRSVSCLPQRNPYHRFPADIHAFEAVIAAGRLATADEDLPGQVARESRDDGVVLLATLLHDIGKGSPGDHSETGARIATAALRRMGFGGDLVADVEWLVANHLLLADTATRRDLDDEGLIVEVAERVGAPSRWRALYLLSVADAMATGSAAWNPWKARLMGELFVKVAHVLERGELVGRDASDLARKRTGAIVDALVHHHDENAIRRHVALMPRAWLLSQTPETLVRQTALMLEGFEPPVRLHVVETGDPGIKELTVLAPDRPGLLSLTSGVLALNGFNVLGLNAYTREDGLALQVFRATAPDDEQQRFDRVRNDVRGVLRGDLPLPERIAERRRQYADDRSKPAAVAPRVIVDNGTSDFYTLVEVHAQDRIGLLYGITEVLARLDLDIHLAKVATYAHDVVDVFYVREAGGQKADLPGRAAEIERALLEALG